MCDGLGIDWSVNCGEQRSVDGLSAQTAGEELPPGGLSWRSERTTSGCPWDTQCENAKMSKLAPYSLPVGLYRPGYGVLVPCCLSVYYLIWRSPRLQELSVIPCYPAARSYRVKSAPHSRWSMCLLNTGRLDSASPKHRRFFADPMSTARVGAQELPKAIPRNADKTGHCGVVAPMTLQFQSRPKCSASPSWVSIPHSRPY